MNSKAHSQNNNWHKL